MRPERIPNRSLSLRSSHQNFGGGPEPSPRALLLKKPQSTETITPQYKLLFLALYPIYYWGIDSQVRDEGGVCRPDTTQEVVQEPGLCVGHIYKDETIGAVDNLSGLAVNKAVGEEKCAPSPGLGGRERIGSVASARKDEEGLANAENLVINGNPIFNG
ncbi:unnamed protein product [Clonostachys rosea]|uniref:Uncharacterized protein n=1 Tax=Bionectria ochroleuca TaxID=29856 RepID=A0ABY6TQA7_BIOOC|nr:unnamed protein product [Clonostachys rosea]